MANPSMVRDHWGREVAPLAGDFVLAPISGFAGKGIEWGQELNGDGFDPVQHAAMYLGGGWIVEAEPGGARKAPVAEYPMGSLVWSTGLIDLSISQRIQLVAHAVDYIGTPYSALDYFSLAAHRLHLRPPGLKRYIGSTKHMICSQLVDQCYQDAGIQLFDDGRWPGDVTPGALYRLLQQKLVAQREAA